MNSDLIKKYDVPLPRYTSYPTVPYWEGNDIDAVQWADSVRKAYRVSGNKISLYIHLPFCESLCTYCACNMRVTRNHAVEEPYIAHVLKEWQMYVDIIGEQPQIAELHLGGGTPTFFSPDNLDTLINGILKSARFAPEAALSFEAHPAQTLPEHLETLYRLAFRRLSLGVQDFDPHVQKLINRKQNEMQVKALSDMARIIGYSSVNYDLIYGLPGQTLKSIQDTVAKVISMRPDRIAFYSYAHVPWVRPGQRGYEDHDIPQGADKRALYELGRDMLLNAGYEEIGLDHFALPGDKLLLAMQQGTLHRNFMGYTEQHTDLLLGIGVSSISDTGTMFAQNLKSVEEWQKALDEGKLPLLRGHVMTAEDVQLRKHILDIMCKGETDVDLKNNEIRLAIQRLEELSKDGIVELHNNNVKVTKKGVAFLRNAGACFDARLHRAKPDAQVFSTAV